MHNHVTIDQQPLLALRNAIGDDKAKSYLKRFLDDCSVKTDDIQSAYKVSDFTLIQHITHTLASSSATFGAMEMHTLCRQIEDNCVNGTLSTLETDIKNLNVISDLSKDALQEYI